MLAGKSALVTGSTRGIVLLRSDADGAVQLRLRVGEPPRIVRSRHDPARYWRVAVPP